MQLVLLYGSDSWVLTRKILKVLTVFHHWAAQQITWVMEKRGAGREWEYPAVEEAMDSSGIHFIGIYIKRCQTNIAYRVACRPVYALSTEAERMPGTRRMVRWWDQDAVNEPEE